MVFYPLLTQTSAVFVQMNQHRNIKKMLRWKLLRSRAERRFPAITPSTHLRPTASFYFLIRVFPFLTDSTESGNVGKMRRMRNCEWKMGMKEETCWGSTGSYSGLYGIFQTMSFLVVKRDFEKNHITDLFNSNSGRECSWCTTARKAGEGRKTYLRDSDIITIKNYKEQLTHTHKNCIIQT